MLIMIAITMSFTLIMQRKYEGKYIQHSNKEKQPDVCGQREGRKVADENDSKFRAAEERLLLLLSWRSEMRSGFSLETLLPICFSVSQPYLCQEVKCSQSFKDAIRIISYGKYMIFTRRRRHDDAFIRPLRTRRISSAALKDNQCETIICAGKRERKKTDINSSFSTVSFFLITSLSNSPARRPHTVFQMMKMK